MTIEHNSNPDYRWVSLTFNNSSREPSPREPYARERLLNVTHLVLRQQVLPEVAGCGSHVGGCDRRRRSVCNQLVAPTAGSPSLSNAGRWPSPLSLSPLPGSAAQHLHGSASPPTGDNNPQQLLRNGIKLLMDISLIVIHSRNFLDYLCEVALIFLVLQQCFCGPHA